MRLLFKQAVHLGKRDYHPGVHEVDTDDLEATLSPSGKSFFEKLIAGGHIVEAEETKVISAETLKARSSALAEKLKEKGMKTTARKALTPAAGQDGGEGAGASSATPSLPPEQKPEEGAALEDGALSDDSKESTDDAPSTEEAPAEDDADESESEEEADEAPKKLTGKAGHSKHDHKGGHGNKHTSKR